MQMFELKTARTVGEAVALGGGGGAMLIAGGTNLVDTMKLNVQTPRVLVDINPMGMDGIEATADGGLRIGALARNTDVANHELVKAKYPVLSQAILSGATTQLRNMASTAGNLLQKTRCVYYRDTAAACNKREPGSGCSAIGGYNRNLAVLGVSEKCIATNPSDQNVALAALEAVVHVTGAKGERAIPIAEFYVLPGETPQRETVLMPGDVVTHVTLPPAASGAKSVYLKLRDRASYEFALASAAVVVSVDGGKITHARVAMGGVGTVPWRSRDAERVLMGKPANEVTFRAAAEAALHGAKPQSQNGFKVELAKRCVVAALQRVVSV